MTRMPARLPSGTSTILVVDDMEVNRRILRDALAQKGWQVVEAAGGLQALDLVAETVPDLVLLDVLMPDLDGFEVCRRMRAQPRLQAVPIVMVTSLDAKDERLRGLEAGADDFLTKPVDRSELLARAQSLLRVKALFDEVCAQREALDNWAHTLEQRVQEKLAEVAALSTLKRFFSPQLASRLVAGDASEVLRSHRREVSVLFTDLRGFTPFAETAHPDDVMALLREFHGAMGALIFQFEGTLERFTGDGMMVFFNDPDPVADHPLRAVRLGLEMSRAAAALVERWRPKGGPAGMGVGISSGVATLGAIGFDGRLDYAAIGSVTNQAARLCGEARAGEVLVSESVWSAVAHAVDAVPVLGGLALRGFAQPAAVWRVVDVRG
jgi:adenylate cyclase